MAVRPLVSLALAVIGLSSCISAVPQTPATYDLVILNGRAIDPETGLDAIRNIGVEDGQIAEITEDAITGAEVIDASGLIVAPGFIDLHAHGQSIPAGRMQAFDGVTTALELESGVLPVAGYYDAAAEEGRPINYGASVGWAYARIAAFTGADAVSGIDWFADFMENPSWQYDLASGSQTSVIMGQVQKGLDEGALGIGVLLGYAPDSGRHEYYELHELAARNKVPTFTHARFLSNIEPDSSFEGFQEMIAVAATTGAHLHISHLNSIAQRDITTIAPMIRKAQDNGVRITVEAYPYGAGATSIGAAMFRRENWQAKMGDIEKSDFTVNGEALSDDEFDQLQAEAPGTGIVVHFIQPDSDPEDAAVLAQSVLFPGGAIASDGGDWTSGNDVVRSDTWPLPADAQSHPRSAGTFSRFLRIYVREQEALSLSDALAKTSLIPAQILEESVPQMRSKGRLQVGADADIVVFDLATVGDSATYAEPARTSVGFSEVIVDGTRLIRAGQLETQALPGQPIRRPRNSW